jgi:hypothetical protein
MLDEYEAFGGIRIGWGNGIAGKKPVQVQLSPPQIPHDLTLDRTRELPWEAGD